MATDRETIFLVDDSITNLTAGKAALIEKYDVIAIPSGEKLLKILEIKIPDLILLDVEMPEMNGYDVIKIIKSRAKTCDIPVIFLTAKSDSESEIHGLSLGAVDYIIKPFSPVLLLTRIKLHLLVEKQKNQLRDYNNNLQDIVIKKTKTVLELQNVVLKTAAELVEFKDDITGNHIERTQKYLRILLTSMLEQNIHAEKVLSWDLDLLLQSSLLHDVGKIAIKDSILQKPAKLTPEEFEEIKSHTTIGVKILEKIEKITTEKTFLHHAKIFAGTHHEKWDGSGYPSGLIGDAIPLQGRIMAIADVYDALISARPYKRPFSHKEAVEIIKNDSGTHFDPDLVGLFVSVSDKFDEAAKEISVN